MSTIEEAKKKEYVSLDFYLICAIDKDLSLVVRENPFSSFLFKNGAVLVNTSKEKENSIFTWYFPKDRINKINHGMPIDTKLTYTNAERLEFTWVEDILFRQA